MFVVAEFKNLHVEGVALDVEHDFPRARDALEGQLRIETDVSSSLFNVAGELRKIGLDDKIAILGRTRIAVDVCGQ